MILDNLQDAIYNKLAADGALSALVVGIYARAPDPQEPEDPAAFPFVVIGDNEGADASTKTSDAVIATSTIRVWTMGGLRQCEDVSYAVYRALHKQDLYIQGANFIACRGTRQRCYHDPDGVTQFGVLTFRTLYDDI